MSQEQTSSERSESKDWAGVRFSFALAFRDDPDDGRDVSQLVADVREALKGEPRVRRVGPMPQETEGFDRPIEFRGQVLPDDVESSLREEDILNGFQIVEPLTFQVEVPRKNQPDATGFLPERHWVAWNGVVMVVAWQQPRKEVIETRTAEIVLEVVHEAVHSADLHLHVQRCSQDCAHPFLHGELLISEGEGPLLHELEAPQGELTFRTESPDLNPERLLGQLYWRTAIPLHAFFRLKNATRRVANLEQVIRADAAQLLEANHTIAVAQTRRWWERIRFLAEPLKARQEGSQVLARLLWELSILNAAKGEWERARVNFEQMAYERHIQVLTRVDRADIPLVENQDLGLVRTAIEQAASRMDTRLVAASTAWGAVAGAITGATLGGIVS